MNENGHLIQAILPGSQYLNRFYGLRWHQLREVSRANESTIINQNKHSDESFKLCHRYVKDGFIDEFSKLILNYNSK